MVTVGNKSRLASSAVCQRCGKCCKTFSWADNLDQAIRFLWLEDDDVKVEDTPFKLSNGDDVKVITLNRPCKMLEMRGGKYFCRAYRKERPDFCTTYPDHVFFGIEEWNREKIQRMIDSEKQHCPLFETLTVDEVIQKVYEAERGEQ